MNEVMDFEETESLNEDIFDCEYTSVDAMRSRCLRDVRKDRERNENTNRLWRGYRCIRFLY